jgi:hypothetical protein
VSPIYVRPEREQAEHDRLIRFLQAKYKKFDVIVNPGDERNAGVKIAAVSHFPDLILNEDKRLAGLVEIETAASVNNLETMAKWVPFSRARVPFHLYVPVQGYEAAVRLAEAHHVKATEIWTYRPASEGFDLVRMFVDTALAARPSRAVAAKPPVRAAAKVSPKAPLPKPESRPVRVAKVSKTPPVKPGARKPVSKAKPVSRVPARPAKSAKTPAARAARPAAKTAKKGSAARKRR